ncbi:hypothetical protein ZWY2020_030725 [Hordeum vulgare]|nr:hypothetical protein ZWY2020_030725 [Hordeum vulgare]
MGVHRVLFESDSLQLVNGLISGDYDLSNIGVLLREARSLCHAPFDAFEFRFVNRECNRVAHELADFGYKTGVPCTWWKDYAPGYVLDLVASESDRRIPNSTRILHLSSVISTHILLTSVATSTISYLHADLTEVHQNVAPSPSPLPTGHVLPAVRRWDDAGGQGVRGAVVAGRGGGGGATEVGPAVHGEGFAEGRVAYRGGGPVAADAGRGDGPGSASQRGSHESDMDLAMLVSDFLEGGGGGGGDSRGSSDDDPGGLHDLTHLADKISRSLASNKIESQYEELNVRHEN